MNTPVAKEVVVSSVPFGPLVSVNHAPLDTAECGALTLPRDKQTGAHVGLPAEYHSRIIPVDG